MTNENSRGSTTATTARITDERLWNAILAVLLVAMVLLVARDFIVESDRLRQWDGENSNYWNGADPAWNSFFQPIFYSEEEKADWKFEWRLQDVEEKLKNQKATLASLKEKLGGKVNIVASLFTGFLRGASAKGGAGPGGEGEEADGQEPFARDLDLLESLGRRAGAAATAAGAGEVVVLPCGATEGRYLRVGLNGFNAKTDAACGAWAAPLPPHGVAGPNYLWEKVDLGGDTIGLRSLANSLFLKVLPPPMDEPGGEWRAAVASPLPGLAERFRLREWGGGGGDGGDDESPGGLRLHSELLQDYLQCPGGGAAAAAKGVPGSAYYGGGPDAVFRPTAAAAEAVTTAIRLRDMSSHINRLHRNETEKYIMKHASHYQKEQITETIQTASIAIIIPMTSKGTEMTSVKESPFWFNTFQTFCYSIDWAANRNKFTFFIGFDKGDPIYDLGDSWNDFRKEFKSNAGMGISWQTGMSPEKVTNILETQLAVELHDFGDLAGAPSQVVNRLAGLAYDAGFDYIYQINDDTEIETKQWHLKFMKALASNPVFPNFGVTGPTDSLNPKIFTHAFVHRTHIEAIGSFFPSTFKNWWSDDWISTVYGEKHTFRHADVQITHNVEAQKTSGWNRYDIDYSAQYFLEKEIRQGFVTLNRFLRGRGAPGLPLPDVCGFSPAVGDLMAHRHQTEVLAARAQGEEDAGRAEYQENLARLGLVVPPPGGGGGGDSGGGGDDDRGGLGIDFEIGGHVVGAAVK